MAGRSEPSSPAGEVERDVACAIGFREPHGLRSRMKRLPSSHTPIGKRAVTRRVIRKQIGSGLRRNSSGATERVRQTNRFRVRLSK